MATGQSTIVLITRILDLILVGAEMLPEARERAQLATNKLRGFAEEGRDPHPGEWEEIDAVTRDLLDELLGHDDEEPSGDPDELTDETNMPDPNAGAVDPNNPGSSVGGASPQ